MESDNVGRLRAFAKGFARQARKFVSQQFKHRE